jgi:threonine synthase
MSEQRFHLKCRECGEEYSPSQIYVCSECFGPLEVVYNYDSIKIDRETLKNRQTTIWRYLELLPITDKQKIVNINAGWSPLHKCERLSKEIGLKNLYIKNDTVNPTGSFKDRPASIAVSKTLEFGAEAIGCASTGNLAAALASCAAKAGINCYIFAPYDIEANKITQASIYDAKIIAVKGTYDEANRLATQAAEKYHLLIANINVRPYYVEGSKTLTFEVCEQLGLQSPDHVIVPAASGALICATSKAFKELQEIDLTNNGKTVKISAAQPKGCAPIVNAFKSNTDEIIPVEKPNTIAKSLAIGDPGDGIYALKVIRESGGIAEYAADQEIIDATRLLAKTEGIYAEPAGSVTIAVLKKLVENGQIAYDEVVVCYVTGSGLKTPEVTSKITPKIFQVEPSLKALEKIFGGVN